MNKIEINGKVYIGNNVDLIGRTLYINGIKQESNLSGIVEVRVLEGVIDNLTTDASVSCHNVNGDVKAGGSVNCANVQGDVKTGGSVNCGSVAGSVKAGGSVNMGR